MFSDLRKEINLCCSFTVLFICWQFFFRKQNIIDSLRKNPFYNPIVLKVSKYFPFAQGNKPSRVMPGGRLPAGIRQRDPMTKPEDYNAWCHPTWGVSDSHHPTRGVSCLPRNFMISDNSTFIYSSAAQDNIPSLCGSAGRTPHFMDSMMIS